MKRIILCSLVCFLPFLYSSAQDKVSDCKCPETQFAGIDPAQVFHFSSTHSIALCGYTIPDQQPVRYSEFVLSVCGEDRIIDFWDAMTTCEVQFVNDTLYVKEMYALPLGTAFEDKEIPWTIEKLYFSTNRLERTKKVNRAFRKYDESEIASVLQAYSDLDNELTDDKLGFIGKLFVAAISGSEKARTHFLQFRDRYPTLDGGELHGYRVFCEMLEAWEKEG